MTKALLSCLLMISMMFNAQISLGTGSTNVGAAPISTYYGYSYVQQIFTKQEINANAAGNITGLKFYLDPSLSIANSSDWVVYLGQTSKTSFMSVLDWIPASQLTQVYTGNVTNNNGVIEITFATPFPYNNTSNLVVAAEENSAGYDANNSDEAMYVFSSDPNSTLYFRSDTVNPDPFAPSDGNLEAYKSVVTFVGLTPAAIPICPLVLYPVNDSTLIPFSPAITWTTSSGATGYKISIGTTPGGTDIVNQQLVTTNSFTPSTALAADTNFYVRVVAVGTGGESSACSETMFKTIPPPPSNDECSSAITLTVNPDLNCGTVTAGYTLGATDSGLIPDPCYGDADDDVWFKFVATSTTHKISLNNILSIGSDDDEDTYFQVFDGSCSSLSSILCSDATSSTISGLTVGSTYYVRVYSYYGAGSNQSFDICIGTFPPPPANDACSGALQATAFPYNYVQSDGEGATNNGGFITACTNGMNDGTWFTFTGNGNAHDITVTMPSGSEFDAEIGVYTGSCGNLVCVDRVDDEGEGGTETISIPTVSGTTYFVNVGYYDDTIDEPEGTFTINITNGALATSEVKGNKNGIKAYPNPFTEVLMLSDVTHVKSISISDISGRLIKMIDQPTSTLQLGELKSGLYMITLQMKDGSKKTIKAIKK